MRRLAMLCLVLLLVAPAACDDSEPAATSTTVPATTSTVTSTTEMSVSPREVALHEMVYDAGSDVVLVMGGCVYRSCVPVRDLWSLDPAEMTWTEFEEMPLGLQPVGTPAAYDTESDSVVFLQTAFLRLETDVVSTWVYDTDEATWTEMTPEPHPRLGVGARMVYDTESDRIITHGGAAISGGSVVLTRGTWAYDYNTNTWEELNPSTEPPGINYQAMAYDSESDRTVLFGLNDGTGETLLWAFDYNTNTWEEMPLTDGPAGASVYSQAAYDPVSDRILVFGGQRIEEVTGGTATELAAHNELWSYDYNTNTWEQRATNESSGPLANHAMVRIGSSGAVVVFGGGPSTNDTDFAGNDLWVYDPATDTWTSG
jgi:hypothetical protein